MAFQVLFLFILAFYMDRVDWLFAISVILNPRMAYYSDKGR